MEWREAISEARDAKDIAALDKLRDDLNKAYRTADSELAALLDVDKNPAAATESVRKLKFMDKLIAEVGDAYEMCES